VDAHDEAFEDDARYLGDFVKGLRERADPVALGIEVFGRRRRNGGLRQSEMARLMRISETWYQKLESGRRPWSERLAAAFAEILKLSTAERLVLYKRALGQEPEAVLASGGVSEPNRAAIDTFRVPALLMDHSFKVRYHNQLMNYLLPPLRPGLNLISWIVASPIARELLVEWERDWALSALAQLRTAWMLTDAELRRELDVIVDVARLVVPHLWERDHLYYLTPTGEKRRIKVYSTTDDEPPREVAVRLWSAEPDLYPGWKILTMQPLGRQPLRARRRRAE
jgi:transcriptional regulator with XRE-family HTH domain